MGSDNCDVYEPWWIFRPDAVLVSCPKWLEFIHSYVIFCEPRRQIRIYLGEEGKVTSPIAEQGKPDIALTTVLRQKG